MLCPVQDKVVLKIKKDEEVTKSGIMNNGVKTEMEVKEGDNVFVEKGVGIEIKYDDEEYLVVTQKDILAIIK